MASMPEKPPEEEFVDRSNSNEAGLIETVTIQLFDREAGGVRVNKNQPGERFGVTPTEAEYLVDERKVARRCFTETQQKEIWDQKWARLNERRRIANETSPENMLRRFEEVERQNALLLEILSGLRPDATAAAIAAKKE